MMLLGKSGTERSDCETGEFANALKHVFRHLAAAVAERAIPMASHTVTARTGFQVEAGVGNRSVMDYCIRGGNFTV